MAINRNPNRLHESAVFSLSGDEAVVGIMVLQTDGNPVELAINAAGAAMLRDALDVFLDGAAPPLQEPS